MRPAKNETRNTTPTTTVQWEVEKAIVDILQAMEKHSKIPLVEHVNTALKRYISGHKDYLPDNFKA